MIGRFSTTRTGRSGSCRRSAGRLLLPARPSGFANKLGSDVPRPYASADGDRLFAHPADGLAVPAADQAQADLDGDPFTRASSWRPRSSRSSRRGALRPSSSPTGSRRASRISALCLLNFTVLGAWSALYYAINFFLQVEEQIDHASGWRTRRRAQLAMLRYQLNPHFLFNTLNSISTLVLLKQTERANAMLSRLSSFLRYTLVNEPTAHVTVAQEVETLKLYLEIEKMRFEERLRPAFRHRSARRPARGCPRCCSSRWSKTRSNMPSRRRRKAPKSAITARPRGDRVQITVSDTGPGLMEPISRPSLSTGVGLANIRDRLAQAYGDDHRFETRSEPSGGLQRRSIEIPFRSKTGAESSLHDHPHHSRRRRAAGDPGPAAPAPGASTTSRSSTPARTAARRSARSRPTSPTSSSSTSRCPASTASRSSRA